jgi:peptidoglycan hydrolase-like protein with peptidoglycan-binding domain
MTALPVSSAAAHGTVKRGSHGSGVRTLQRHLGVAADGIFGPATKHALRHFQRAHGLAADGVAGPATWAALGHAARTASSHGHAKRHMLDGTVRGVQRALGISVDGVFGPQTLHAVRAFQRAHGLTVDGIVGPQTWAAMSHGGGTGHTAGHHHAGGGGVRALQHALGVSADGVFGPQTEAAVRHFQRAHGLTVDGVVGPQTRAALGMSPGRTLSERQRFAGGGAAHGGGGAVIQRVIAAANRIATLPYRLGGGHGSFNDTAYDCSGSVSYALHGGGLLSSPEDSTALESYGAPGPGKHITIYANAAHTYMTINGRRFGTIALQQSGSRWASTAGSTSGYVVRHPVGY